MLASLWLDPGTNTTGVSTHTFACALSTAGISLAGTAGTVLTLVALYLAVPGLNWLGYVKIFTLTRSLITQPGQWQSALNASTCQLPQETLFVNILLVSYLLLQL